MTLSADINCQKNLRVRVTFFFFIAKLLPSLISFFPVLDIVISAADRGECPDLGSLDKGD